MDEKNTERTTVVSDRSGTNFMPFVIGALVVAVAVLGWMFLGGETANGPADVNMQIDQPASGGSGDSAGGNAGGSAGGNAGGSAGGGAGGQN